MILNLKAIVMLVCCNTNNNLDSGGWIFIAHVDDAGSNLKMN